MKGTGVTFFVSKFHDDTMTEKCVTLDSLKCAFLGNTRYMDSEGKSISLESGEIRRYHFLV